MKMITMPFRKKAQVGFTLLETIVAIAIMTIVLAALLVLLTNFYKVFNAQQSTARVSGSATIAGNELQAKISQATQIVTSATISGTLYTTDSDTLVLELPSINGFGAVIAGTYDYAVFYVSSGALYERVQPNGASSRPTIYKQLSNSISSTSFTYNSGDVTQATKVDINILMQLTAGRTTSTHQLKQTLYLRNQS